MRDLEAAGVVALMAFDKLRIGTHEMLDRKRRGEGLRDFAQVVLVAAGVAGDRGNSLEPALRNALSW